MKEIIFKEDPYQMNWLREDYAYAEVTCPKELECKVDNQKEGDVLRTEITVTNVGNKPFISHVGDIAIALPLQDRYENSDVCLKYRCHTHIFCGENISYVMALRMGGEAPHLGMVLTKGSLAGYSIKRNMENMSNDRGCFLLHPSPMEFEPGESMKICWIIFPHNGKDDFFARMDRLTRFVKIEAEHYVLFLGEKCKVKIMPSFIPKRVTVDGAELCPENGSYSFWVDADRCGERKLDICVDEIHTWCRLFVQEKPETLAARRCQFIACNQQYYGKIKGLKGAYLAYDNEESFSVYIPENDYNGGRERIGMGNLISRYLKGKEPENGDYLNESLQGYLAYVERELVETETGRVCNDMGMDDSYKRLYNAPWFATFFCELYLQYGRKEFLTYACRIVKRFYEEGGIHFYPIEMPIVMLDQALRAAGMEEEAEEMKALFIRHGDQMIETGLHYPAHEVNYEQSIVAPAADILLKVYQLTGDDRYLQAGRQQVQVLELFNGMQPDYHLYETAIRHWDGYWFGKRKMFGDTFPHYWSALTGNVFEMYGKITGDEGYLKRAEDSRRGVLPLIFPDGSASCAYVYPYSVNGVRAEYYDPYANDQDWGLYFYLRAQQAADR